MVWERQASEDFLMKDSVLLAHLHKLASHFLVVSLAL